MQNNTSNEIITESDNLKYEYFRAIKTFCIVMIIFCIGFILRKDYNDMLENSRYLRFYPEKTLYYSDYKDVKDFSYKKISFDDTYKSASYGIVRDEYGNNPFLIVAKNAEKKNLPLEKTQNNYYTFTCNGYTFISDSKEELINLQNRIKTRNYGFLYTSNVRNMLKKLDKNRDNTLIIANLSLLSDLKNKDATQILDKIYDKIVIQVFKEENSIKFTGEATFQNSIAGLISNIKNIDNTFNDKKIKISDFDSDNLSLIIGVKDFDLWAKIFMHAAKTLPDNQYVNTFEFIESVFNMDFEEDIVKKLNGNAVFYLYKERKNLHPLLLLDTKQDLMVQAQKYFNLLQFSDGTKFTEQEFNHKTYKTIKTKAYPHNFTFGAIDDSKFILGHQRIIEKFLNDDSQKYSTNNSDFYLFVNIKKVPVLKKNKGFWTGYKTGELNLSLTPAFNFEGKLSK